MYNVFKHDQLEHQAAFESAQRTKSEHQARLAREVREQLANNHYRRMTRQVARMAIDPTPIVAKEQRASPQYLGEPFFRHQPKDAQQRVHDALEQNKVLDPTPNPKPIFKLRQRRRAAELHSDMHFTARDRFHRLTETWSYQRSLLNSSWDPRQLQTRASADMKSYYKTLETMAYDLNGAVHSAVHKSRLSQLPGKAQDIKDELALLKIAKEAANRCNLRSPRVPSQRVRSVSLSYS